MQRSIVNEFLLAMAFATTIGCNTKDPAESDASTADTVAMSESADNKNSQVLPSETVFLGATLFDGTGRAQISDVAVLVEKDSIIEVGKKNEIEIPADAKIVDVGGKWIVPGLIDAHIHFFQSGGLYTRPDIIDFRNARPYEDEVAAIEKNRFDTFKRYLVCGVTSVVDMGGPFSNFSLRDLANKELPAPRVAVAGPLISTVARDKLDLGDPPIIRASSPEDARSLAKQQLDHKPDLMKIWFVLTPDRKFAEMLEVVKAVIDESHKSNVRVAVHATELLSARAAVEAGADILVHSVIDEKADPEFLDLLVKRGVIYIPTLTVFGGYSEVLGGEVTLTELDKKYGDPRAQLSWTEFRNLAEEKEIETGKERIEKTVRLAPIASENLVAAWKKGVVIAAGTDAGNIGTLPGASLHEELTAMVSAGLSEKEVLLSATRNAARVFTKNPEIGTIESGKLADMLILDADPLDDISNLGKISLVVKGGVVLSPDKILAANPNYIVDQQLDAYNSRDTERFVSYYSQNALITRHPTGETIARGREGIRRVWGELFAKSPTIKAKVVNRIQSGNYIIDQETVTGIEDRPYFHGVAIYEIRGELIDKVWFLPK